MLAKSVILPSFRTGKITWLLCSSSGDRGNSSLHPGGQGSPLAKLSLEYSAWSALPPKPFRYWSPAVPWVHLSLSGLARAAACPHPQSPGAIWLESGMAVRLRWGPVNMRAQRPVQTTTFLSQTFKFLPVIMTIKWHFIVLIWLSLMTSRWASFYMTLLSLFKIATIYSFLFSCWIVYFFLNICSSTNIYILD